MAAKSLPKRVVRITLGVLFVVLGIPGLVLPILQGVLLLSIGLSLLSPYIPPLRRLGRRLRDRYPRQAESLRRARERLAERGRRILRIGPRGR